MNETAAPAQAAPKGDHCFPRGSIVEFVFEHCKAFPGTSRTVTVYVPAQYRADRPACVYFSLDGLLLALPDVFDRLISSREMPVTIAIGVAPGSVVSAQAPDNPRYCRSVEFDSLSDTLARFLIEEIVPEVERCTTAEGLPIRLSRNPNDRAVGGVSTGGIGAFTAAWERPDLFRRVFTAIGTFVGMRGGDRYPVLVRKTEPKPLRIFLQDGSNDQWPGGPEFGDWWLGNQAMQRALEFAGYEVACVWGEGPHDMEHATAVFPDAMRWLWQGWPRPIERPRSRNSFLQGTLRPEETWHRVAGPYQSVTGLVSDRTGQVVFRDHVRATAWSTGTDGVVQQHEPMVQGWCATAYDDSGCCYIADAASSRIFRFDGDGGQSVLVNELCVVSMVIASRILYVSSATSTGGCIWAIGPRGDRLLVDACLRRPAVLALSPDRLWLSAAESEAHWGFNYRIERDGTLANKQRFYWFHVPDDADGSGLGAWVSDCDGRLYAVTRMGVQIFDRNGRVRAILPTPGGAATGVCFGGPDLDRLYVSCADAGVYWRKLNARGVIPGAAPISLPSWNPG